MAANGKRANAPDAASSRIVGRDASACGGDLTEDRRASEQDGIATTTF
jgi:hypothetical protein